MPASRDGFAVSLWPLHWAGGEAFEKRGVVPGTEPAGAVHQFQTHTVWLPKTYELQFFSCIASLLSSSCFVFIPSKRHVKCLHSRYEESRGEVEALFWLWAPDGRGRRVSCLWQGERTFKISLSQSNKALFFSGTFLQNNKNSTVKDRQDKKNKHPLKVWMHTHHY